MKRIAPRVRLVIAAIALGGLLASGCGGGKGVKVKGRLLDNGQPYHVSEEETVQLLFLGPGTDKGRGTHTVLLSPDGTFTVPGPEDQGLPPGTYQIELTSTPYAGGSVDKFKGKFTKAPVNIDVTPATKEILIDVGKGTVAQ